MNKQSKRHADTHTNTLVGGRCYNNRTHEGGRHVQPQRRTTGREGATEGPSWGQQARRPPPARERATNWRKECQATHSDGQKHSLRAHGKGKPANPQERRTQPGGRHIAHKRKDSRHPTANGPRTRKGASRRGWETAWGGKRERGGEERQRRRRGGTGTGKTPTRAQGGEKKKKRKNPICRKATVAVKTRRRTGDTRGGGRRKAKRENGSGEDEPAPAGDLRGSTGREGEVDLRPPAKSHREEPDGQKTLPVPKARNTAAAPPATGRPLTAPLGERGALPCTAC
mmetsp:Transcript_42767/g.83662  ORF Transcript_42767/g.83662 Transcript_42767/m.83662 type:complete len:284 (+) Transcript_42767:265-1116(+)